MLEFVEASKKFDQLVQERCQSVYEDIKLSQFSFVAERLKDLRDEVVLKLCEVVEKPNADEEWKNEFIVFSLSDMGPKLVKNLRQFEFFFCQLLITAEPSLLIEPMKLNLMRTNVMKCMVFFCEEINWQKTHGKLFDTTEMDIIPRLEPGVLRLDFSITKKPKNGKYTLCLTLRTQFESSIPDSNNIMTNFTLDIALNTITAETDLWRQMQLKLSPIVTKDVKHLDLFTREPMKNQFSVLKQRLHVFTAQGFQRVHFFPPYYRIKQITASKCHTIALLSVGVVLTWGEGVHGALGHGDAEDITSPKPLVVLKDAHTGNGEDKSVVFKEVSAASTKAGAHSLILSEEGEVYSFGLSTAIGHNGESISKPTKVFTDQKMIHVRAGGNFSLLVGEDGKLVSFGCYAHGRLGLGKPEKRMTTGTGFRKSVFNRSRYSSKKEANEALKKMPDMRFMLSPRTISVYYVGEGEVSADDVFIVEARCSHNHCLALDKFGRLFGWGKNNCGQVGDGSLCDAIRPVQIRTPNGERVKHISVSRFKSSCVLESGVVCQWGLGAFDQQFFDRKLKQRHHFPKFQFKRPEDITDLNFDQVAVSKGFNHQITDVRQFMRAPIENEQFFRKPTAIGIRCSLVCSIVETDITLQDGYCATIDPGQLCLSFDNISRLHSEQSCFCISRGSRFTNNLVNIWLEANSRKENQEIIGLYGFDLEIQTRDGSLYAHRLYLCPAVRAINIKSIIAETTHLRSDILPIHLPQYSRSVLKYLVCYIYCGEVFTDLFHPLWLSNQLEEVICIAMELGLDSLVFELKSFVKRKELENVDESTPNIKSYLNYHVYSDVVLRTCDGREIHAHKVVLAVYSDVLKRVMMNEIRVNLFFSFDVMMFLLRFMYTETVCLTDVEHNLQETFQAISFFQLSSLRIYLEYSIELNEDNISQLLQISNTYLLETLQDRICKYFVDTPDSPCIKIAENQPSLLEAISDAKLRKHAIQRLDILDIQTLIKPKPELMDGKPLKQEVKEILAILVAAFVIVFVMIKVSQVFPSSRPFLPFGNMLLVSAVGFIAMRKAVM